LNKAGSVNIDPTQNRTVKEAGYKKIIELDTKYRQNGGNGIDAIFIYNTNAIKTYKADFETAGIPVIHTKCTNPRDSIVGFRTFGFLFGTEGEKQGNNIAEYTVKVLDHVSDTLKKNNISGDKMTDVLVLFSKTSIAEANSQYTYATQEAGGNVINQQSGASAKLSNEESILTFKNPVPEVIVSFTTMGFKKVTDEYLTGTVWDIEKLSYLNKSPAYKDLVYVNASLPVSARIATVAEVLYPDLFKDYGATTWQTYADNFMPFLDECADDKDYNVKTDCTNTITYSDYKRAGGKN
ncbi:MAG: ABC transporter substrate-binding protein, partial [Candidatus Methanomethylophilaceae archaeon]|nr:ABC transporter substrate-binding protein [Candidatus Methanomethylophilaceae archaeon]